MSSSANTLVLGYSHVSRLLADASFYSIMPEFGHLKAGFDAGARPPARRGCGSCHAKRAAGNMMNQFTSVMSGLAPERRQRLKEKLGAVKVLYYGFTPGRGTFEVREL